MGNNGNLYAHQAAVALKYGIAGINFIPQRPEERFSLAKLALRLEIKKNCFSPSKPSEAVRNLGSWFDSHINMNV